MISNETNISTFLMGVGFDLERYRFALEDEQFDLKGVQLIFKSVQFDVKVVRVYG